MKKILFTLLLVMTSVVMVAQTNASTIKFLGIPVDGKKADFITALKSKGFTYDTRADILLGKFNGIPSIVYISENNGKVDRVIVTDDTPTRDEANIRIRYNHLISQFENLNEKYYTISSNQLIPDEEDFGYEMRIHKKRYNAVFYYNPLKDNEELAKKIAEEVNSEVQTSIDSGEMVDPTEERVSQLKLIILGQKTIQATCGQVWFTISEQYGQYSIAIYYENMDNMPNGEDL